MGKLLTKILESKFWKALSHLSVIWPLVSAPTFAVVALVIGIIHHHSLEWILFWCGIGIVMGLVAGLLANELWVRLVRGKPHIIHNGTKRGPIYYNDKGFFERGGAPPLAKPSFALELLNQRHPKRKIRSTGKCLAQLTYKIGSQKLVVTPGTWIGEFFSSVEIGPGETRELIIALCFEYDSYDWRAVRNRRRTSAEAFDFSYEEVISTFNKGTIEVEILSSESGTRIGAFEIGWRWDENYSPAITFVKPLS